MFPHFRFHHYLGTAILLSCFCITPCVAQSKAKAAYICMKNAPDTFRLLPIKELDLKKHPAGFNDFEQKSPGLGYSQYYGNPACRITVYLYNKGLKNITRKNLDAEIAESRQVLRSAPKTMKDAIDDVSIVPYRNAFLKIRYTCGKSGRFTLEQDMDVIRIITSNFQGEFVAYLDKCIERQLSGASK
ncbi:MAG: hypothetical protein PHX68_01235 [Alphaproteobacteria bacterium]|nr:hypothetical protein [Alphaproteobacteria bacterium]